MDQPPTAGITGQQPPTPQQHHQKTHPDEQFLSLSREVSDLLSRLRLLEERYANLRREHQTTSQNMIENHQNLSKQQRKLSDGIISIKRSLHEMNEQIATMQGELASAAKNYDLKVLQRYLDYWEPLQFITREEADKLIREALQRPKLYKSVPLEKGTYDSRETTAGEPSQDDASPRDGQQPDHTSPAT